MQSAAECANDPVVTCRRVNPQGCSLHSTRGAAVVQRMLWVSPTCSRTLGDVQRAEEALAAAEQERADMESSVTALAEDLEQRISDMSTQVGQQHTAITPTPSGWRVSAPAYSWVQCAIG